MNLEERDWYEFAYVNQSLLVEKATITADDILAGKSLDDMIREQTGCLRVPREFFFVPRYPLKEVRFETQEEPTQFADAEITPIYPRCGSSVSRKVFASETGDNPVRGRPEADRREVRAALPQVEEDAHTRAEAMDLRQPSRPEGEKKTSS